MTRRIRCSDCGKTLRWDETHFQLHAWVAKAGSVTDEGRDTCFNLCGDCAPASLVSTATHLAFPGVPA